MCRCVLCLILGHSGAVVVLKFYGFFKFFFFLGSVACDCDDSCFGRWCWYILMGFVVGCWWWWLLWWWFCFGFFAMGCGCHGGGGTGGCFGFFFFFVLGCGYHSGASGGECGWLLVAMNLCVGLWWLGWWE